MMAEDKQHVHQYFCNLDVVVQHITEQPVAHESSNKAAKQWDSPKFSEDGAGAVAALVSLLAPQVCLLPCLALLQGMGCKQHHMSSSGHDCQQGLGPS